MEYRFTDEEINNGENIAQLEDLEFSCEYFTGSGALYRAFGSALIEGEIYRRFEIEFVLENEADAQLGASQIFNSDWLEYDYICPTGSEK